MENNMKAMRDALERVLRFLQWLYAQEGENAVISRVKIADEIDRVISTLSAPPRNMEANNQTMREALANIEADMRYRAKHPDYVAPCVFEKYADRIKEALQGDDA